MALRTVLQTINSVANRQGRAIEPLMSLTVDFYIRLFIRVKDSLATCQKSITRLSTVHQCTTCEAFYMQPLGFGYTEEQSGAAGKRAAKR